MGRSIMTLFNLSFGSLHLTPNPLSIAWLRGLGGEVNSLEVNVTPNAT